MDGRLYIKKLLYRVAQQNCNTSKTFLSSKKPQFMRLSTNAFKFNSFKILYTV